MQLGDQHGPGPSDHSDSVAASQSGGSHRYDPTVASPSAGVYDLGEVTRLDVSFPSAWIETTNHVQIYDIEPYVGQATTALIDWLENHMPVCPAHVAESRC